MEKTVKNNVDMIDEVLDDAKGKGSKYWEMAKEKGQNFWNDTESTRKKTWGLTKGFVQKHPAQAIGYAALLGAVIAVLLMPKGGTNE